MLVLENQPDFSVVAPRGTERSKVPSTRLLAERQNSVEIIAQRRQACADDKRNHHQESE
jgi:hypothetical protein